MASSAAEADASPPRAVLLPKSPPGIESSRVTTHVRAAHALDDLNETALHWERKVENRGCFLEVLIAAG
jgi:hypothetical protein